MMKSLTKALKPSYFCEAPQCKRLFSSKDKTVFEQALKQRHRNFALSETVDTTYYNYLRQESNLQLIDRVNDINREFPVGLELGSFDGGLYNLINSQPTLRGNQGGIGGIQYLVQTDMSAKSANNISPPANSLVTKDSLQCDEGYLPFQSNTFDIVLSSLYLHWSNDLFKTFSEIERVLKPDGVVIASLLGNDSLKELRNCFYLAEQERRGGIAYHTSPFMRTWDVAGLMQDAKFNLPTVDIDSVKVSYDKLIQRLDDISYV